MGEVEYRREMNRNYMVIQPEITGSEKYTTRMLSGNRIQGLLAFQDKMVNGEMKYYYDITSKQPLHRVLEHRTMSGNELRSLVTELIYMLRQLERFLLDERQLCLRPEYIYVDPSSFKGEFCLIPGMYHEFSGELCELSQYLLDHVNHSDGEAVVLAFSIFRECRKLNFGIEDIERCLGRQEHAEKEEREQKPDVDKKENSEKRSRMDEMEMYETEPDAEERYEISVPRIAVIGIGLVMILVPAVVFFVSGIGGWYRLKWILLAVELLAAIILFLILRPGARRDGEIRAESLKKGIPKKSQSTFVGFAGELKNNIKNKDMEEEPWEVYFHDEEEAETKRNMASERSDENSGNDRRARGDEIQTALLNSRPMETGCRRLASVNGGANISIGYFPFLIGKNKDLTDFYLDKPGVSRLHVKIEKTAEGYSVTDLNSTNGTAVNGSILEANETAALMPGDELMIANERFYFR